MGRGPSGRRGALPASRLTGGGLSAPTGFGGRRPPPPRRPSRSGCARGGGRAPARRRWVGFSLRAPPGGRPALWPWASAPALLPRPLGLLAHRAVGPSGHRAGAPAPLGPAVNRAVSRAVDRRGRWAGWRAPGRPAEGPHRRDRAPPGAGSARPVPVGSARNGPGCRSTWPGPGLRLETPGPPGSAPGSVPSAVSLSCSRLRSVQKGPAPGRVSGFAPNWPRPVARSLHLGLRRNRTWSEARLPARPGRVRPRAPPVPAPGIRPDPVPTHPVPSARHAASPAVGPGSVRGRPARPSVRSVPGSARRRHRLCPGLARPSRQVTPPRAPAREDPGSRPDPVPCLGRPSRGLRAPPGGGPEPRLEGPGPRPFPRRASARENPEGPPVPYTPARAGPRVAGPTPAPALAVSAVPGGGRERLRLRR